MVLKRLGTLLSTIAIVLSLLAVPAARSLIELPASVTDVSFPTSVRSYGVTDYGLADDPSDTRTGTAHWRVVEGSGNCCENYVTTDASGRLYDFGGTYVNYSDDLGETWKSVRPLAPLLSGEGTIVVAPNGDILGVGWDPYSGDHLQSFKYDASAEKWVYSEIPIHTPFFDREWVTVVPGPVTLGPTTSEYVVFLKGAWPSKEFWFYSLDGVSYLPFSSKMAEQTLGTVTAYLEPKVDPKADWYQPNTNGNVAPLGNGVAVAAPDYPQINSLTNNWTIFNPQTFRWSRFAFPNGTALTGRLLADSLGRLHEVRPAGGRFLYRLSADGGRTWNESFVDLPVGSTIEEIDFRANAAAGVAVVAIHAHEGQTNVDKDLLFKIDITSNIPILQRFYMVGLGDINASAGVGADIRFDFETVAILPDGRVAMSFLDSTTGGPQLAIELGTDLDV